MEYKSAQISSQSWYFTDLSDSRLAIVPPNAKNVSTDINDSSVIVTGGGQIAENNTDVITLFKILTNSLYNETKIPQNHVKYRAQKYMMTETDWYNFEVTGYFTFNTTNPNSRISIYGRSGEHVKGRPCEGTYYRVSMYVDGSVRCDAKHWHPGGTYILDPEGMNLGDMEGMRVGFKVIVFNNKDDNSVTVRALMDMNENNTWEEVCYFIDTGEKVGNLYVNCGDDTTKVITWAGPVIGIEVVNFPLDGCSIDSLSVREIDALAPKIEIPIPAAAIDPEAVSPPTAPPSDGYRTDLDADDWDDDTVYPLPLWGDPGDN